MYEPDSSRETRNELEESLASPVGGSSIVFPENLDEIDHWMAIRVHNHEFQRNSDFAVKGALMTIFLPLPQNLQTQYDQKYNVEGLGPAGSAIGKAMKRAADSYSDTKDIIASVKTATSGANKAEFGKAARYYSLAALENNASEIGGAVGGAVGGPFAGITGALAGEIAESSLKSYLGSEGIARNPFISTLYEAPNLRTHSFSWKCIPRNLKESISIFKIIGQLKYFSSPGLTDDVFFTYPQQFDIDFHYGQSLFNIAPSVLTSLSVNYHSEGEPLYFNVSDPVAAAEQAQTLKYPVSITIDATFQETTIITKESMKANNR